MFWYILMGFLAAFGALCALWVLFGLLLPGSIRCHTAIFCPKNREIAVIRRFCRLRELGLTRSDLTVLDSSLNGTQQRYIQRKYPYIKFSTRQAWLAGQGKEGPFIAGTGDFTGNHRGGGIPEL